MYVVKIVDDDYKVYNNFYFNSKDSMKEFYDYCNRTVDKSLFDVIKTEVHPMDVESAIKMINSFNEEVRFAVS